VAPLLDRRLIFVTGKGGAGKTTIAAALGLAAARRGKRTMVCEVAGQADLPRALDLQGADTAFIETEVAEGLSVISIDPQDALEEYLRLQVSGPLYKVLFENRIFQYLAAATPGMRELVTMGKIWELAQLQRRTPGASRYDFVVVDAPASGHGLAMLQAPSTFRDVASVGPVRRQAGRIHSFVTDPGETGVLVAALAEEMPVAEAIELRAALRRELGMDVDGVVVNGLLPERFSGAEVRRIERAGRGLSPAARAALASATFEHAQARGQRSHLRRIRRAGPRRVVTLPFLFGGATGRAPLERLSRELERKL
jgi:anion-transporting  ArsA/GET3 family ATPase